MAASTKELGCCQMKEAAERPVSEIPIRAESDGREADSHSLDEFSHLLVNWSNGERAALDRLITLVYEDLRRLAHHYLGREHPGHTLQTTALVDEAYLRLLDQKRTHWKNRAQFFSIAAQMMRRILVDHARSHYRAKRGGGARKVSLDDVVVLSPQRGAEIIALDDALERLSSIDPRKCRIVELRYFGGLTVEETADVLGISPITVKRDWLVAKAWLRREISNEERALEAN